MSKVKVGINGFGRIGRQVFRALHQSYRDKVEVVAINDLFDVNTYFHLAEYDSVYGRVNLDYKIDNDTVTVGDWKIHCFSERDPKQTNWGEYGVDIVVESTGIFRTATQAAVHLENGAKKVIITAPAKEEDITIVMGVNQDMYDPKKHNIVSNASCTTNCLAPVALVLEKEFGIELGNMVTIHSYTNDQRILDMAHKDLRRARAAACNIIPTSTGAAQAVAKVIPQLKGKFSGYSLRVPTPTVSVVDFSGILKKPTTTEEVLAKLKEATETYLKGIMEYNDKALVSMDFKGNPASSIVEASYTTIQNGTLIKAVAWYDNEWGYSNRVCDLICLMKEKGF
ncbi:MULTISPECIES: type I glyceraldehyde-3-phosphate dehydrogenase [unclassified Desulfovibrio]|uniref:type I glyceraldehyde-3-phosphate dehydrogenase n=1 Tax=unclassified Desulfovibrio TaxID=2593640 RepID=UPI0013E9CAF8|nr:MULTISPECIES: type I glyceraldehyde-3-phosphate dehydrogenase [unclassified Desulfovibrio]MBD5627274.1 type I glyceraldehyde-3-phosphate dehydrogenase [Desulfovibrio sp.]MBD5646351.1 type I glyceraldehyde-3-phosphate dehydrogenase [Desulfovibrio sp.]MDE6735172.1 type I glyceraldehyde-3-phosphate dehydrogenase [Desulfovibrio sp.]MDE7371322.1 type I glyceraldehyde-3-phosphate dehydrogenase [Desulfovibrio sp.]